MNSQILSFFMPFLLSSFISADKSVHDEKSPKSFYEKIEKTVEPIKDVEKMASQDFSTHLKSQETSMQKEKCPNGWSFYEPNNKCFYVTDKRMPIYDAIELCYSQGAVLASIHSDEENDFITSLLPKSFTYYFFIGLERGLRSWNRRGDGEFQWMDGTNVTYTNWQPGQPDRKTIDTQNYVAMVKNFQENKWFKETPMIEIWEDGKWDDVKGDGDFYIIGAVCQKEAEK